MQHEALAVRLRRVELGVRRRRVAEELAPLPLQAQAERVVERVSGLVPQDAHAPFVLAAFDFEHLRLLELLEARVRQVERDGDRGGPVRREPFVRQIEVNRQAQPAVGQLVPELRDAVGQRPLDAQRQVGQPEIEQLLVPEFRPVVTD